MTQDAGSMLGNTTSRRRRFGAAPVLMLLGLGLALAAGTGCLLGQNHRVNPDYRDRAKAGTFPAVRAAPRYCQFDDARKNGTARTMLRSQLAELEGKLASMGPAIEQPDDRCTYLLLTEKRRAGGYWDVAPIVKTLREGVASEDPVLYFMATLTTIAKEDIYGNVYYQESDVVEIHAYLIAKNGDIIFDGLSRCGVGGESYYGSASVPACSADLMMSQVMDGAPVEWPGAKAPAAAAH